MLTPPSGAALTALDKYLRRYADAGTAEVLDMPAGEAWSQVLVIPVCDEESGILRTLPPAPGRTLMILVVNEPESSAPGVSLANRRFADDVRARFERKWKPDSPNGLALFTDPASRRDILLVDRFSDGLRFAGKGGVGHARKTGADLAAFLHHRRRVKSPWIHCSDADVALPERYFSAAGAFGQADRGETAALIYPFRHVAPAQGADETVVRMSRLYEYSLRYYVAGLKHARSPYAFHTIGSTMAVNAEHYAKVRGFPRREAGEDFYLLNKLAKVGPVQALDEKTQCGPIEISSRLSDRVPFGTGAAVGKMVGLRNPAEDFLFYHPAIFGLLKGWLQSLPVFWQRKSADLAEVLNPLALEMLVRPLQSAGADQALEHSLRQSSDATRFTRHVHTWFDAFRTLKLVHFLRDHHFPSISFVELHEQGRLADLLPLEPSLSRLHEEFRGVYPQ